MKQGFLCIRASGTHGSLPTLEREFRKAFPSYFFKSKTVYKHLKAFDDAVKFNLLETICAVGKNPGGKWSDVVKAAEEHKKGVVNGKCSLKKLHDLTYIFHSAH
ncbi:hypothetical protein B0H10DRAFT_807139 [Mycena sp. CBHHK59/15]|nr:hypothetical protein B0H10DRAFT_807139 [Mycena sp. CBHHK59/15]